MSFFRSPLQYLGVAAINPPDVVSSTRDPTSADNGYTKVTFWLNTVTPALFSYPGTGDWLAVSGGGGGDVVGPGSSTNGAIPTFKQTTGKLIQNSLATLDSDGNLISPTLKAATTTTTTDTPVLDITAQALLTGTPVAGFGAGVSFVADNSINVAKQIGGIQAVYASPTSGAEDAYVAVIAATAALSGGVAETTRFSQSGISTNTGRDTFQYVTGTWTPALSRAGVSYVYTTQQGHYSKIGNIVHFAGEVVLTSATGTGSGNLFINGLPFATKNVAGLQQYFTVAINNVPTTGSLWVARSIANTNLIGLGLYTIDTATTTLAVDVGGTSIIFISGTYLSV